MDAEVGASKERERSKETKAPPAKAPPTKRGPYKKKSATAAMVLEKAEKAALKKQLKESDTKAEVAALKVQLKAAIDAKKAAEEQLVSQKRVLELELARAHAEGEKEGMRMSGEEYKKGVAAGAAIASGQSYRFSAEPSHRTPASAGASSFAPCGL